jgi:hypothetical protein
MERVKVKYGMRNNGRIRNSQDGHEPRNDDDVIACVFIMETRAG